MAYYDEFVRDPDAALREIAERRNISPAELARRVDFIASEAQSGAHLTLGQAKSFVERPDSPDKDLSLHVDSCAYCKDMLDGLDPTRIDGNLRDLRKRLLALSAAAPVVPGGPMAPSGNRWLPRFAYGAFVVLLSANIVGAVALFNSHRKIDVLSAQVVRVRQSNDERLSALAQKLADFRTSATSLDSPLLDAKFSLANSNSRLVSMEFPTIRDKHGNYVLDSGGLPTLCAANTGPGNSAKDKPHDSAVCVEVKIPAKLIAAPSLPAAAPAASAAPPTDPP